MVFNGTFEKFPGARLILGHMGETLPYLLWRFDSRAALYRQRNDPRPKPSEYIKRNIPVTISGVLSQDSLACALSALGENNVMFAADYPFEDMGEATTFLRDADIPEDARRKVASENAANLLRLS
jgi:2,3-dihydroxybenzoate decarboxylase